MRSCGKSVSSAATQVKVISPEMSLCATGQGFHSPEASIVPSATRGRHGTPGSQTAAGETTVGNGTWEDRDASTEAAKRAEEATRRYVVPVIGPAHSRGVDGVMPVAGGQAHSKEPAAYRREEDW